MDHLLCLLYDGARADKRTQWFPVITESQLEYVESMLEVQLPELLRRCYLEISNGGFGPGNGLIGLPGGHEGSWGNVVETAAVLEAHEDYQEGWFPIID